MFDVELDSIGQKTLAAPRDCFWGSLGFFFCVVLCFFCWYFFSPKPSVAWMYCRGGRCAGWRAARCSEFKKRRIHIQGLSRPVPCAVCFHSQAGNKPKTRWRKGHLRSCDTSHPFLGVAWWERGGERGPHRFNFRIDPNAAAVALMKAVSGEVLREIYSGMLLTWRNGFCNADSTFFLKAINMVTNGCYKLDGLSQIGLFLRRDVNQGLWGTAEL